MIDAPAILDAPSWWADLFGFARPPTGMDHRPSHLLRTHLISAVLLALMPCILVTITIGFLADTVLEQSRQVRTVDVSNTLAAAVDREFERVQTVLMALAGSAGADQAAFSSSDNRVRLASDLVGGKIVLRYSSSSNEAPPALMPYDGVPSYVAAVLASGRSLVTDVVPMLNSAPRSAIVVVPVLRQFQAAATIEATISSDRLIAVLRGEHDKAGGSAVLVDASGRIAASTRNAAGLVGKIYTATGDALLRGAHRGDMTVSSALIQAPGWRVFYTADREAPLELQANLSVLGIAAIIIASCFAVAMTCLVGARMSRKLRALTNLAQNVATGSKRAESMVPSSGIVEFEDLRRGMIRADAVLRRRAAAERMALREARTGHELLVSVVNGTAEWTHVKDLELRYVLVNRAGLNAGPKPLAEWQALGRTAIDLFPPEIARRIEAADQVVLATGRTTNFEEQYVQAGSGRTMWVSMTVAPWKDANGRMVGIVSVSRDITERHLADTRLRAIQADLLRVTRLSAMGAMASGLAHELNQPLAAATNYLNAGGRLLDRAARGDVLVFPLARSAVSDGVLQLLRAGAIVRRLRDFVERGEVELRLENVGDLLREACDLARSDGVTEGIMLRHDIDANAGEVLVDRTQIQQVLLNLIRNAAEAILSAEPIVSGEVPRGEVVVQGHHDQNGAMQIDVCDNGAGLSPGIADRLFEPFVSSKQSGMGIGLAICRTIIEGHGGTLTAQPNAIRGMRFRIILPALISSGEFA